MRETGVTLMRRLTAFLMVMVLAFSAFAIAETEEGDDSNPVPVDMMDDETEEEESYTGSILQYGDEGDEVLALQTRLKELKYYGGDLSGRFREGTQKAVENFQEDFDLDRTGVADMRTLSILFSLKYRPLRYGYTGEDVKELQKALSDLGYYKNAISGNYLENTRKAVETLQKKTAWK
jgi:Putative peptidoglycan-binding domain-containing protein